MADNKQATWGGRFSEAPAELMIQFGESVSFDQRLAPFDIAGSKGHAVMLHHVGLLTADENEAIQKGLDEILEAVKAGNFTWQVELEDVHMNIEQALTEKVEAAAKLHTARSRNDQIATDMRLFFKDACQQLESASAELIKVLLEVAEANSGILIPGYTHLQRAQPVSAAHHLLAWVAMLDRDRSRFSAVRDNANWCPLGVGAMAGTTLPIDREFSAKVLGFTDEAGNPRVTRNSMDTVADRDVFIEFAAACAICGTHLSRIAEDIILWNSSEFAFVTLPDAFTTGSSIMPQKKNPDSMELMRGKSARLHGNLSALLTMVKGLPLTYNRDLQEDKPPVFDSLDQTLICLKVLTGTAQGLEFRTENCRQAVGDPMLLATDVAEYLVARGMPFRKAHHIVGAMVAMSEQTGKALNELPEEDVRALDAPFGDDRRSVFDLSRSMAMREKTGMPGPEQIKVEISRWRKTY